MTKKISIKLTHDPRQVVAKAKATANKNGVHFSGDDRLGRFVGMGLEGRYDISDDVLVITITRKPMLLSWPLIEAKMKEFFKSVA